MKMISGASQEGDMGSLPLSGRGHGDSGPLNPVSFPWSLLVLLPVVMERLEKLRFMKVGRVPGAPDSILAFTSPGGAHPRPCRLDTPAPSSALCLQSEEAQLPFRTLNPAAIGQGSVQRCSA